MRAVILLAVVAYVAAQGGNIFNFGRGDHIHGYTFQYHRREKKTIRPPSGRNNYNYNLRVVAVSGHRQAMIKLDTIGEQLATKRRDLLLVRNATACFLVDADKDVAAKLEHKDSREALEDAIYLQIKADQGETVAKLSDLRADYHDALATVECFRHKVYKLTVSV